jgi:hypothetical protein
MNELENALAWFKPAPSSWLNAASKNMEALGQWIWEVIQGDFNAEQSTGQIVTGTVISMIPLVDQICDVRDLCANAKSISKDDSNVGAWVALCFTLIGLFPVLGSFAKGALKVMFLYMRKAGFTFTGKVVNKQVFESAINGLNKFLDLPATRKTLTALKIYNPYKYLADQIVKVQSKINKTALLNKLDELINAAKSILQRASDWGPASIKQPIKSTLDQLVFLRQKANNGLGKALAPLNETLRKLAKRLEIEGDNAYRGTVNATNPHKFAGINNLGEADLIRKEKPKWAYIGKEVPFPALKKLPSHVKAGIEEGWPDISKESSSKALKNSFETFDQSIKAAEVMPGDKLYRVVDPRSADNSICWMREAEFKALKEKADWRRRFAVWKHWNGNGEYVTYVVPPGKPLKVWEGRAATQELKDDIEIKLEGGAVQIVLDPAQLQKEYLGKRQLTNWGYTDAELAHDPDVFIGIPRLVHNWFVPK